MHSQTKTLINRNFMHFRLLVERNLDFVQRLDEITEFRLPTGRNLNFVKPADDYDLL